MKKLLQLIIKLISHQHFDNLLFCIIFAILVHTSNLISNSDIFKLTHATWSFVSFWYVDLCLYFHQCIVLPLKKSCFQVVRV